MTPTDDTRALDREIAERLGWKPEKLETGWRWRKGDMKWTAPERLYGTAEGVFDWLYDNEVIPHYSGDLNAAITLTVDGWTLSITQSFGEWTANYYGCPFPGARRNRTIGAGADTPALAICRAYLAYTAAAPAADGDR